MTTSCMLLLLIGSQAVFAAEASAPPDAAPTEAAPPPDRLQPGAHWDGNKHN